MKITYTRKEIDQTNSIAQQLVIVCTNNGLKEKSIEEQIALSNGLMYFTENGDVVMEIPEEVFLKVLAVYQSHMPTIIGIVTMLKGVAMTFRNMCKGMTKELNVINNEFNESLERKAKLAEAQKEMAENAMEKASAVE